MYGYATYNINPPDDLSESKQKNFHNSLPRTTSAPFALDEDETLGDTTPQTPITPKGIWK